MVQLLLCSLDQLMDSGFGRPFPRHGLQLLFWFANDCVTCEPVNVMKLASDCQPEKGFYGFHVFGNVEELLPVLRSTKRRKNKRKVSYFEVGNLNTETYPASADLPVYVRENYGLDGNYGDHNSDRIIISYQARSRVVEAVYVTEHDDNAFGRFRADRTFEISCSLIRVLQNQQLDVSSLLAHTGYYDDMQETQPGLEPSVQEVFDMMQALSRDRFFTGDLDRFMEPFSFDQQWTFVTTPSSSSTAVARCGQVKPKKPKTKKKPRGVRRSDWEPNWEPSWEPSWEQRYREEPEKKKRGGGGGGGGLGLLRMLLGVGALYLAFRCFGWWRRICWEADWMKNGLSMMPWRVQSRSPVHVMLDYVY
ncbi:uncharacterized protein LOC103370026 [Stegastes partitus]|uniref:Uncharacterized LOC103370026 n=1 Tax=Stegastes partitus TaxID=144197 RepID=A0A3B4Z5T1_9TELE|nr:PREDICTED: uncharacterized protein LOC103370026 [Stegastes partitus]XP_008297148.1 PREDICTED: uncharacterized protein LOC103370026 [Stegastes partitus]